MAWSLIGGTAAFLLAAPQDWVLLFSGMIAVPFLRRPKLGLRQTVANAP